jgi:hypothetical protein
MVKDYALNFPEVVGGNSTIPRKTYGLKPELALSLR